jgi:hypothetical protein
MSPPPLKAICVALALTLCSCDFSDPLSAIDNGEGMVLVDSLSGWNETSRTICVRGERSRTSCSSRSAEVYLTDVPRFGQLQAEWRNGDPHTVDVFLFGGSIERCQSRSRDGDVNIVVRQLPIARMPSPDIWNPDVNRRLFEGQPNRCQV